MLANWMKRAWCRERVHHELLLSGGENEVKCGYYLCLPSSLQLVDTSHLVHLHPEKWDKERKEEKRRKKKMQLTDGVSHGLLHEDAEDDVGRKLGGAGAASNCLPG